jgi:hypothetical protein
MTRQGELLATYSRYLGRYPESGIYSDPYRTRVWPTDRHSTAFLRDESCRMRVQALIWQTHGRPLMRRLSAFVLGEIGGLVESG